MRTFAVVLLAAVACLIDPAAASDNAPKPPDEATAPAQRDATPFTGTWSGTWPMGSGSDVEIVIGKRNPDGTYKTKYTWGAFSIGGREFVGGTKKIIGRERGEAVVLEWEARDGNMREIILTPNAEDTLKARLERLGTIGGKGMWQNFETSLRRR